MKTDKLLTRAAGEVIHRSVIRSKVGQALEQSKLRLFFCDIPRYNGPRGQRMWLDRQEAYNRRFWHKATRLGFIGTVVGVVR